ncbi:translation initiation factor Sui1 [Desulfogranum marinum]|uniref:translation initiation factor Sui1 n=1 Tax=Desulfogranum marinum TaxID=453220 RepID=UPI00196284B7|nr:translation initiation factor Sui1 [Desulfogranum marinum]MBM9511927.1 translation initiation factor Sui1 [Desulfogranum marinum]
MKKTKNYGLVYSTDKGRMCPQCGHPEKQCCCSKQKSSPPGDGQIRVSRQTKGRKGAGVSIISGIALDDAALKKLAKQLKQKCGSGGTAKNGIIEIQGDHRQTLVDALNKLGYKAKLAGG